MPARLVCSLGGEIELSQSSRQDGKEARLERRVGTKDVDGLQQKRAMRLAISLCSWEGGECGRKLTSSILSNFPSAGCNSSLTLSHISLSPLAPVRLELL